MPIDQYFLPRNPKDALSILQKGGDFYLLSGGTSLSFGKAPKTKGIIDLSQAGLNYIIQKRNGIYIGATSPVGELVKNSFFSSYFGGVVKETSLTLATTPLRNLITVGGNVLRIYPWSTLPVLFLALGAKFKTMGKTECVFEADEFLSRQPRRFLKHELLKEIILPVNDEFSKGAYLKYSFTKTDFALLNIAVILRIKKGKCNKARIVIGAISSLPIRLEKVEGALIGSVITQDVLKSASKISLDSIKPLKDFRIPDDYKMRITPVLIERCLLLAWERFKGVHS